MSSLIPAWTFLPDKDVCTLKWINVFSVQCFLSFPAIFFCVNYWVLHIIRFVPFSYFCKTFRGRAVYIWSGYEITALLDSCVFCIIHIFIPSFIHYFIHLYIHSINQSVRYLYHYPPPFPPFLYGPQEARRRKNLLTRLLFIYIISVLLSLVFSFFSKMAFFIASCNRHFNCRRRRSIPPIL